MRPRRERKHPARPVPASPSGARVAEAVVGPALCAVRVWTEAEWATLPEAERRARREHVPGLGRVGAVPVRALN